MLVGVIGFVEKERKDGYFQISIVEGIDGVNFDGIEVVNSLLCLV